MVVNETEFLTTGQVAKICRVASRTVGKWFDEGALVGYRLVSSNHRRVNRKQLIEFMKQHGMPLGELEGEGLHKILVISSNESIIEQLKTSLPNKNKLSYDSARSGFGVGLVLSRIKPDTIVADLGMGRGELFHIVGELRRDHRYEKSYIIGLANEDETDMFGLRNAGFNLILKRPFDMAFLVEKIRERTEENK